MNGHSGDAYGVTTLKSYLSIIGIIMQKFKINKTNSNMSRLTKRSNCYGRADRPTLIIEKLPFKKHDIRKVFIVNVELCLV